MIITSLASSCVSSVGKHIKEFADDGFFLISQIGYSNNKKFAWLKYWPAYLSGAIAVASTVASIASYLMNNVPNAIFHGTIALSCLVIAGVVHTFVPLKRLEGQTADLHRQNIAIQGGAHRIETSEEALRRLNKELTAQIEQARQINAKQGADLAEHMERLEETSRRLIDSDKKVEGLEALLSSIQTASSAFQAHVETVQALKEDITGQEHQFETATNCLSKASAELSTGLQGLQAQHSIVATQFQTAVQFASNLQSLFASMEEIYRKTAQEEDELRSDAEQLKASVATLKDARQDIDATLDSIQQLAEWVKKSSKKK